MPTSNVENNSASSADRPIRVFFAKSTEKSAFHTSLFVSYNTEKHDLFHKRHFNIDSHTAQGALWELINQAVEPPNAARGLCLNY